MTCLTYNKLLVSDWKNKSVKLIDTKSGTVACSTHLLSHPYGICMFDDDTALVAMPDEEILQFIRTNWKTLKLYKTLNVSGTMHDITTCCENIVVSYLSPPRVEMWSMTGSSEGKIVKTMMGRNTFRSPEHLTTSTDQQSIYVSDNGTSMITRLDNRLQILQTFSHDLLRHPMGITALSDDEILVADGDSNAIVSLQPSTGTCVKLLGEEDGIAMPRAVAYSPTQKTLYVASSVYAHWKDEIDTIVQMYKHE